MNDFNKLIIHIQYQITDMKPIKPSILHVLVITFVLSNNVVILYYKPLDLTATYSLFDYFSLFFIFKSRNASIVCIYIAYVGTRRKMKNKFWKIGKIPVHFRHAHTLVLLLMLRDSDSEKKIKFESSVMVNIENE